MIRILRLLCLTILSSVIFICCQNRNGSTNKTVSKKDSTQTTIPTKPDTTEPFETFLESFSIDSAFQMSRVKFPLEDVNDYEDGENQPYVDYIEPKYWHHMVFVDTSSGTTIIQMTYDNFDLEMRNTGERVISYEGIETDGTNNSFYFKKIEGKWYLVKRVHN